MKDRIEAFLVDLDRALAGHAEGEVLEIYPIGRAALAWEYGYSGTTQDIDFLRPRGGAELVALALKLFGYGTQKAKDHSLYLQVVEEGFPPMPWGYKKRAKQVEGSWERLRVYCLDPYELVASKLRRFSGKDRADVRLLCDLVSIDPVRLEAILEEAYPFNMEKDGDEFRDSAFRSLRVVQRYLRHETEAF
jgi:hypothetical protein